MIDKIGVNSVNHVKASKPEATKPTFKGQDELPQIEELRGSELLANYSVAFINKMPKEKFVLKDIPLINAETSPDKIEGEKIYTSDGKLDSIVVDDDETITIYYPSQDKEDFIDQIKVIDKATGKKVLSQDNWDDKYGLSQYTYKFSKDGESEIVECSAYHQGKLCDFWKDITNGDKSESLYAHNNEYSLSVDDKQTHKRMVFDKEGNLVAINTTKNFPKGEITQDVAFIDGQLYKASQGKQVYFKQIDISSILADDNFKPAERFPFTKLPVDDMHADDLEGEKTYYSNGTVETVNTNLGGVDAVVTFSPQGIVKSIKTDSKELKYDENRNQIIEEKLGGNETKTTTYIRERKSVSVCYQLDGNKKTVSYDSNGKIELCHSETPDGERTTYHLNEEGFITGKFSYNTKDV